VQTPDATLQLCTMTIHNKKFHTHNLNFLKGNIKWCIRWHNISLKMQQNAASTNAEIFLQIETLKAKSLEIDYSLLEDKICFLQEGHRNSRPTLNHFNSLRLKFREAQFIECFNNPNSSEDELLKRKAWIDEAQKGFGRGEKFIFSIGL
jgi:hypothetical protein